MTKLIVGGAFLWAGQDFVGFGRFFKFFFGRRIVWVAVRVVFHGHTAIGLFQFLLGNVTLDA